VPRSFEARRLEPPRSSGRRLAQCSTNSLTRTVDTFAGMWIIVLSCSSRGVVMGRREDGAAVRNGAEMCLRTHRVDDRGKSPPSADAAPRASGKRAPRHPGDGGAPLPGNRTRRQELADRRGWSTFSKARPVLVAERRRGAPGGAFLLTKEEGDAFAKRPTGWSRRPSIGGLAHPRVCRRSAPLEGGRDLELAIRRTRRRSNNTGDQSRLFQ
jgi:hypothetical protein